MEREKIISIIEKLKKTNSDLTNIAFNYGNVADISKLKIADRITKLCLEVSSSDLVDLESQLNVIEQIVDLNNEILEGISHKTVPTCELVKELAGRTGVTKYVAEPYVEYNLKIAEKVHKSSGPANILVVID